MYESSSSDALETSNDDVVRQILTRSTDDDLESLRLYFYIVVGVYGFILLVLIGLVIGLFVWVNKLSTSEEKERPNDTINADYKISRPKVTGDNNYKRFTLPPKQEDEINSDVFFGGGINRNPLSQQSSFQKPKSLNSKKDYDQNRNSNYRNDSNIYSPAASGSADYYNYNQKNKFTY